jgi:hypothetical protein
MSTIKAVMGPPTGFIFLRDAADELGRKIYGAAWLPLADHNAETIAETIARGTDPMIERVVTLLGEQCEQGAIAAAYRSRTLGADPLDPAVWHTPNWRHYFIDGKIVLELPLLDHQGRPSKEGFTARCDREIFVSKDGLAQLIKEMIPQQHDNLPPKAKPKQSRDTWQKMAIRAAIGTVYGENTPIPFETKPIVQIARELDTWLQDNREPRPSFGTVEEYLAELKKQRTP